MRASEYITQLQALIEEYGDLECIDSEETPISDPEFVESDFVLAERA